MSNQPNPHDAVFRRFLGEPANAASHLRAVLPPRLVNRIDLDQLSAVPGSFVDDALRWRHSDLLFAAPLDGRDAFVYLLVEHQSSTDHLMAYRMLRYVVRIWERILAESPRARSLPAVIPVVVHHNRAAWSAPTEVRDLIDFEPNTVDAAFDYLPRFQFILDDLATVDPQSLRDRPVTPYTLVTLLLMQIAPGNVRLERDLEPWTDQLLSIAGDLDALIAMLTYIEAVSETPIENLRKLFARVGPEAEEVLMTTAEMLRTEGRTEGRAEGRAEALEQLLMLKFGGLQDETRDVIRAASPDRIEAWTARVLTADTVEDVLR